MIPHHYEIIDCGAFCEVIFFCISPKGLLGDFFDSLGRKRLPNSISKVKVRCSHMNACRLMEVDGG